MSLTYQPFAEAPAVVELGRQLDKNVGSNERAMTMAISGALFAIGLRSRGLAAFALHASALALCARSVSAHCPLYYRMGVNTSQPDPVALLASEGDAPQPQS